jgi:hypothetical protein
MKSGIRVGHRANLEATPHEGLRQKEVEVLRRIQWGFRMFNLLLMRVSAFGSN